MVDPGCHHDRDDTAVSPHPSHRDQRPVFDDVTAKTANHGLVPAGMANQSTAAVYKGMTFAFTDTQFQT